MSDFDNYSRLNKFEKRRKNTKSLSIMLVLGSIFIVVLIGMIIFGGDDENDSAEVPNNITSDETTNDSNDSNDDETTGDSASIEDDNGSEEENTEGNTSEDSANTENESETNSNVETDPVETDDENVIEAYTGNWEPIGTEQQGPHTSTYDEGTQDRIEMEKAIRVATGLQEGDMITWWLENGGDQKVIGTVSNNAKTDTYRVYLTWVENQGWQPTKVEVLKENDKDNQ